MTAINEIQEQASHIQGHLLSQLSLQRQSLGLTQYEVADKAGMTRMTVQRAEGENANVNLDSFIAMALAVGLAPKLVRPDEQGPHEQYQNPAAIVHRGYAHNRTRFDLECKDRMREAALAKAWEAVNKRQSSAGPAPTVEYLVPDGCTQAQASAMASAIQWLGSNVGFSFLCQAMEKAGYSIEEIPQSKSRATR